VRPPIAIDNWNIDATEVTRGQYQAFVTAKNGDTSGQPAACAFNTSYVPAYEAASAWPPTVADFDVPVGYVDWCDATAYCASAGRRLCGVIGGGSGVDNSTASATTGQWARACAGASNNTYAYGNSVDANRCNMTVYPLPDAVTAHPQCVGSVAGLYNLSGGVAEWTDDCSSGSGNCNTRTMEVAGPLADNSKCLSGEQTSKAYASPGLGFRCCSK
jgi:sulfatase modifying factor 1